ncbi:tyrosine-protein kinase receptor Tie-2-like [Lytechinus variegatus]|uniref:tyrosine-protein kinase receptor Tie-2-like n=1 Tax=Lytechinus variegatus TaxID=7654 RepID=UPI001BB10518|nr:tyrosine-protein kinase receptor Tie-2-like [Lytechinus variegatus]
MKRKSCFFISACVGVYISTTSRGYTSAETGQPFFDCFRSAPDLQAKVGVDRYVYTYNSIVNPANGLPPLPTFYRAGNPSTEVYRINLHTSYHRSYGVFYCSAALDGEYSAVPTIFLRSDAKFVPRRGRFTKTVNRGDVDVTVEFTEVTPSDTSKEWRFNGTTIAMDTISYNINPRMRKRPVYTIKGKVNTSHSGVYEIHVPGQRSQARAGLQRLIVRACPAGRYNESSGCTQFCSSCYNGGICHDQTGECICPPGFQGYSCEIACGGNRFGRNCEYRCDYDVSDDKKACSGLQVCVPDPYGCSCTPGYKGLNCTTECDTGEFGASCSETCHCVSGECDRFTGVCTGSSSNCLSSWTGTNCQGQQGAPPPSEIEAESVSSVIIVTWNASHPLHLNGHITGYTIDYKKISPIHEGAHSKVIKTAQTTNIMYVIDGVKEGEEYEIQASS